MPPIAHKAARSTSPVEATFRPEAEYLAYMRALAMAGPAVQKSLYQDSARQFREQPTPHAKLRFALALSLLDAPYGDAIKARQIYKDLLPPAQPLPPQIESLVRVQLQELRYRITLEERLALMQLELDKAEAKIQALTTIERTLEQPVPETKTRAMP
jgi:hypothetical protein